MGIDLDEFEMVLDARLVELKRKKLVRLSNMSWRWRRLKLLKSLRPNPISMEMLENALLVVLWLSLSKPNVLNADMSLLT